MHRIRTTIFLLLAWVASFQRAAAVESPTPPTTNPTIGASSMAGDWRCFANGTLLAGKGGTAFPPRFKYVEGLVDFAINERVHMQSVTVARRHEGDRSQHIIARRSLDGGETWDEWFAVEPEGGRKASYGGFVRHPATGRIYFIYTYAPPVDGPKGLRSADGKRWFEPVHTGEVAMRYVDEMGGFSPERHILALPATEIDRTNIFGGKHAMIYGGVPKPNLVVGDDAYSWYIKLGPDFEVNSGEMFFVRYHGYAHDDQLDRMRITLLPEGDHGIRGPDSPCIADVNPLLLADGQWLFCFRTTSGYAGLVDARDRGLTVKTDHLRYRPHGRPVKNPEGPLVVSRLSDGRIFLAFYNSSFRGQDAKARGSRDQVFLSHVKIEDGHVFVSEPELFHYQDDQSGSDWLSTKRLNSPRVTLAPQGPVGQSSDKSGIRHFSIPPAFLDIIAGQWTASGVPAHGMILHRPGPVREMDAPTLPHLDIGGGWSISFSLKLDTLTAGQTVLDGWQGDGGVKIVLGTDRSLALTMGDGTRTATIASDPDALTAGTLHHITITADGMPALLSMVVDGRLQDGGAARDRGTVWFDHAFTTPVAKARWTVGSDLSGVVSDMFVHERFLLTSEAVALHRHLAAPR